MLLKKYQKKIIEETNNILFNNDLLDKFKNDTNSPTLCYKVPTGGGKTLIGACVTESVYKYFYKKTNGLIVWLTPSVEIYNQTLRQLRNYDSYIRQILERTSFGKVKIFEKDEYITKIDMQQGLCILVLTIQSLNRKDKDALKYYGFNPNFLNYFYDENEVSNAQKEVFFEKHKDLLDFDIINDYNISHKNPILSLANIVKYNNPLVIVDEAHKYGSSLSKETLASLNPSFIIELTATPIKNQKTFIEVGGAELEEEDMIKLPIYYDSINSEEKNINWKILLKNANNKLIELYNINPITKNDKLRYIRPIMLIRVDFVDEDLKKKGFDKINKIFPSDILDYLMNNLDVSRDEILIKTSKNNELPQNEDLLSDQSKIKYIITKDALKEGWDCPFAYVLANLTTSGQKSLTALTQLIGRVLRQPYTEKFKDSRLNSCYVFYDEIQLKNGTSIDGSNTEQEMTIYDIVVNNLKKEGFDNFTEYVVPMTNEKQNPKNKKTTSLKNVKRRSGYEYIVKLPKILNEFGKEICFYRDILSKINFNNFSINIDLYKDNREILYANREMLKTSNQTDLDSIESITSKLDDYSIIKTISEIVENSFLSKVIFDKNKILLNEYKVDISDINVVSKLLNDLNEFVYVESKKIFIKILENGINISDTNYWELPVSFNYNEEKLDKVKGSKNSTSIFDYCIQMNNGEKKELNNKAYTNNNGYWKIPEKQKFSYYIKGWNKDFKVYPDFIIIFHGKKEEIRLLETKGEHLIGNKDTKYKTELFEALNNQKPQAIFENRDLKIKIALPIIFELKELRTT